MEKNKELKGLEREIEVKAMLFDIIHTIEITRNKLSEIIKPYQDDLQKLDEIRLKLLDELKTLKKEKPEKAE